MPDAIIGGIYGGSSPSPAASPSVPAVPREPGKFSRILGGLLGGTLNVVAPGVGAIIGGLARGGGNPPWLFDAQVMLANMYQQQLQLLSIQRQAHSQSEQFQLLSNLMKAKHDGEMAAIQNLK